MQLNVEKPETGGKSRSDSLVLTGQEEGRIQKEATLFPDLLLGWSWGYGSAYKDYTLSNPKEGAAAESRMELVALMGARRSCHTFAYVEVFPKLGVPGDGNSFTVSKPLLKEYKFLGWGWGGGFRSVNR